MAELSKKDVETIKNEVPALVAKRIKEVRIEKGLTQSELADLILSDRQYLYKIESGKVGLTVVKLAVIAKALEVDMSTLVP